MNFLINFNGEYNSFLVICMHYHAAMAELVDAPGSGPGRGNSVDVQVILAAENHLAII